MKRILIVLLPVALIGGLCAWWWAGGSEPSRACVDLSGKPIPSAPRLLYHGIKLPKVNSVFLKRYYAIGEKDPNTGLSIGVEYDAPGYNPFSIFYLDGTIAGVGSCLVERNGDQILHNIHDVKDGRFFSPKGELVSTVENGTGVQTLFFADGQKYWELHLKDFHRKKLTMWDRDGSVRLNEEY